MLPACYLFRMRHQPSLKLCATLTVHAVDAVRKVGWMESSPRNPHSLVRVLREESMSRRQDVAAPGNTHRTPNRLPNDPRKPLQMASRSPEKSQHDVEIIRKVFAVCDER
jgi:hypothetical protein